jgi:hypothetical protein
VSGSGRASGRQFLDVAAVVTTGVAATVLSWFIAQHSLLGARWEFMMPVAAWVVLWIVGSRAAVALRPRRLAFGLVLVFALATRLAAVTGTTPSISNDLYRYGWDAHVQLSGVDPYRYAPEAAAVRHLRVAPYFPDPAGCAHIGKKPGCTALNRPDVRTIYPAVAEAWFDVVSVVWPGQDIRKWQVTGGLVDMATIVVLMAGLRRSGRDPLDAAWYALSPIPVIEFAGNGHVDGLGLLLLVAAVLALQRDERGVAGVLIGLATMVKLYPAIAVVAAWRRGRWRMLGAAALTCVLTEAPHVVVVGTRILGYLPGYLSEEHYDSGTRFLLVSILPLPGQAVTVLSVVIVLASVGWVLRTGPAPELGLGILLATAILVASPVQPWYAAALGGIGVLAGAPWLVLPALAGEPYYAAVILDDPHQVGLGRLCYGLALLGVAILWRRSRRQAAGPFAGINST